MAYGYKIAVRSFHDCRLFADSSGGHDSYLGLIDDRRTHHVAESTYIGQRESTPLNFIRLELILTCPVGQFVDGFGQSQQVEAVSILDDRHNEVARGQCRCHSYVDIQFAYDAIAINAHIDQREVDNGFCDGFDENGGKRNFFVEFLLKFPFYAIAPLDDRGNIRLYIRGHVRCCLLRHDHVVGNEPAHTVHLNDFDITIDSASCVADSCCPLGHGRLRSWLLVSWRCYGCCLYRLLRSRCCRLLPALCYESKNIFFRDTAILAAARKRIQFAEPYTLLYRNIAHERAVEAVTVRVAYFFGCNSCRGGLYERYLCDTGAREWLCACFRIDNSNHLADGNGIINLVQNLSENTSHRRGHL